MKIMVLNGPNINFTGLREVNVYGGERYEEIVSFIQTEGKKLGFETDCRQSNHEGQLIDWIQEAYLSGYNAIVLNPGAYTHYSYALHDAIKSVAIPTVEVHMSNVHAREEFRRKSVTAPACAGQIAGFGKHSYVLALEAVKGLCV